MKPGVFRNYNGKLTDPDLKSMIWITPNQWW